MSQAWQSGMLRLVACRTERDTVRQLKPEFRKLRERLDVVRVQAALVRRSVSARLARVLVSLLHLTRPRKPLIAAPRCSEPVFPLVVSWAGQRWMLREDARQLLARGLRYLLAFVRSADVRAVFGRLGAAPLIVAVCPLQRDAGNVAERLAVPLRHARTLSASARAQADRHAENCINWQVD